MNYLTLVWSTLSGSHWFGMCFRFRLVSLGMVLSGSFWAALVWSTTLCSRLVYSCYFVLVSSQLDWFGLTWSFLSALLASSVMSVLVCPGWAQALRGWSGILCFCLVGRFVCGLVGLVWLCLCLLAGFSSLAWFDLSGTVQNSSSCPFDIIKSFSSPDWSRLRRPLQLQCLHC